MNEALLPFTIATFVAYIVTVALRHRIATGAVSLMGGAERRISRQLPWVALGFPAIGIAGYFLIDGA